MTPYRDYTQAVCSCLRHATAEEKQAVAQELQDHLADHADALAEAGWDPEEAQAHALAAMGEAKEVGQALNRAFPLRWLILSRVLLVLAVLAAIVLLLPIPGRLVSAWNSLVARADPSHLYPPTQDSSVSAYPLDVHFSLPERGPDCPIRCDFDRGVERHLHSPDLRTRIPSESLSGPRL